MPLSVRGKLSCINKINNMKTFGDFLGEAGASGDLSLVLQTLADSVKSVGDAVRTSETGKAGTTNMYGEEQLELDVLADKLIQDECKRNPVIGLLASEELPEEMSISEGAYAVAYDPLDGSSLVDVNLAVGTIFGIYKLDGEKTFVGVKGDEMVAVLMALYGPRTTFLVALKEGDGVHEFTLKNGEFELSREGIEVGEGTMFSPGNLRACGENPKYLELVKYWMQKKYKLRYSGGMAPDVGQILLKGKGIFAYPPDEEHPGGKLRILFECAPLSFLMEKAGGAASDGKVRILEKKIEKIDQKTIIYIGSKAEVKRCEEQLQ